MQVPSEDMLCRFIPGDSNRWSIPNKRPRPPAFKDDRGLSVWNVRSLEKHGVDPAELLIDALREHGQAHHTAGDYRQTAQVASKRFGVSFRISVEWQSGDRFVKPAWRQWAYAHVDVDTDCTAERESACVYFRQHLSKIARKIVEPNSGNYIDIPTKQT